QENNGNNGNEKCGNGGNGGYAIHGFANGGKGGSIPFSHPLGFPGGENGGCAGNGGNGGIAIFGSANGQDGTATTNGRDGGIVVNDQAHNGAQPPAGCNSMSSLNGICTDPFLLLLVLLHFQ